MKKLFSEHPVLTGIVATIVAYCAVQLLAIPFVIVSSIFIRGNETLSDSMTFLSTAIGAFILVLIFNGFYKKQGFNGAFSFVKGNLKDVYIGLLVVCVVDVVCFIFSAAVGEGGLKSIVLPSLYTFTLSLAAGIGEETMFRAIPAAMMMKNKADDKRIMATVVLTSIIFGLIHFSNMEDGAIFSTTLLQVVAATITGLLYAAVYLRSGSIALPMFVHFAHDFLNFMLPAQATGIMTQTSYSVLEMIPEVAMMGIELALAIYLLRKVNFEGIKNTWKIKWSE